MHAAPVQSNSVGNCAHHMAGSTQTPLLHPVPWAQVRLSRKEHSVGEPVHVALHPTLWQVHASTMDVQPPTIPLLTHVLGVHEHARPAAWHSNWLRNCPQSNGDEKSLCT